MVAHTIQWKEKGLVGQALESQWPEINQNGMQAMGEHFHAVNLPRRFTFAGGRMLGFQRRSPNYEVRKKRQKGHNDPLRWSDASKELALGIKDVRTTNKKGTIETRIVIHARGLNRRNKNSTIRMNDEIRVVSPREHGPLTRVAGSAISEQIKLRDK